MRSEPRWPVREPVAEGLAEPPPRPAPPRCRPLPSSHRSGHTGATLLRVRPAGAPSLPPTTHNTTITGQRSAGSPATSNAHALSTNRQPTPSWSWESTASSTPNTGYAATATPHARSGPDPNTPDHGQQSQRQLSQPLPPATESHQPIRRKLHRAAPSDWRSDDAGHEASRRPYAPAGRLRCSRVNPDRTIRIVSGSVQPAQKPSSVVCVIWPSSPWPSSVLCVTT